MKVSIRKGIFETNSSSVHSLCISKQQPKRLPESITFYPHDYGQEEEAVDPGDYLYSAILTFGEKYKNETLAKLKEILENEGISCKFIKPEKDDWVFGVDHVSDLKEFIFMVLSNKKMLFRFLFGQDSIVYTGNDNSCSIEDMCYCAEEYNYDWETGKHIPNPNHNSKNFDYFLKGN